MITLDLCTFDPGVVAKSPAAFAAVVVECVETSWGEGADIVLLPEFTWMGLEPLVEPKSLKRVAEVFWSELFPTLCSLLIRPGKAVVLGTAPFWDVESGALRNRAPILVGDQLLHQDKLHLTPWESDFAPGTELRLWEFAGLRFAVVICLDIEIPEISVSLRGRGVDVVLVPSATETVLGVERVDRCASARAVEMGSVVGVCHLTGKAASELIDENVGRTAVYFPSQAAFRDSPRWVEGEIFESGIHKQRVVISPRDLEVMRRMKQETNPALLESLPDFEVRLG
ncbi:nitrilase-related carbon-nitrogen hydrolase [Prosthecobacter sp.]|uniref:nitrilase-related carbon-nitrogen hydrolase n=1 Tax=Prosthecobacter sp. TaxID=1965333 RepID=UPI002ABBD2AA|nr:nitrilase-related carbon-nitrogen hydrolase [Prosthecobacter sp.]MDZ4403239.1 nitrilase-related carbon-nitrogen hydrolase [Prosthecobacter sp.]